jgi:hypothetical protein
MGNTISAGYIYKILGYQLRLRSRFPRSGHKYKSRFCKPSHFSLCEGKYFGFRTWTKRQIRRQLPAQKKQNSHFGIQNLPEVPFWRKK